MAHWDNQATKVVQEDMRLLEDKGMVEGYTGIIAGGKDEAGGLDEATRQRKAAEAVARFFREFSPYQRGYIYGHLTRTAENADTNNLAV